MAQFARPDADQAAGSWTTTPLWEDVDEGVAGADGTSIQSDAVGNNSNTSFADLRLSDATDPESSSGHIIRALWNHDQAGRTMAAHAELWQGIPGSGTQIASLDVGPDVGTTPATDTYTLSAGEADSITDYSDLYIRLWGRGTGGGPSRSLHVDAVELEVPDASGGTTFFQTLAATAVGSPAADTVSTFGRTLAPTAVATPVVQRVTTRFRSLTAVATGAPVLGTVATRFRSLLATATGSPALSSASVVGKTLSATVVGVASLAPLQVIGQTLSATAVGQVVLDPVPIFTKLLSATAQGVVGLAKKVGKTLASTAVAMPALLKKVSKSMSATAVGSPVLDRASLTAVSLVALASGVPVLGTQFIEGNGEEPLGGRVIQSIKVGLRIGL